MVDVLTPVDSASGGAMVRGTLDACGYREGQQLAVRYLPGDPSAVTLAGADGQSTAPDALLPLGLAVAGLLAIGAALAVYADGRGGKVRHRHAAGMESRVGGADGIESDSAEEAQEAMDDAALDGAVVPPAVTVPVLDAEAGVQAAAWPDVAASTTPGWGFFPTDPRSTQFPDSNGHGPFTAAQARAISASDGAGGSSPAESGESPEGRIDFPWVENAGTYRREMSSVDLIFPYSSTLAASLHDELFTHRSASG